MTDKFAWASTLGFVFARIAGAQMRGMMGPPQVRGVWNPVVGAGTAYSAEHSGNEKTQMAMAVVGKETVDGKDGYWFAGTLKPFNPMEMMQRRPN
jgi:hypothetical protein